MFGRFVEALNNPVHRAADLQRNLGVDKVLGWQIFRVWSAPDPLQAAPFVPTPGPLARALKAGAERGVPSGVIDDVAAACGDFESLVERHAGDRGSFESMIAGLGHAGGPSAIRDRRAAFRASSRLWGVLAHAQVSCMIVAPGERPGHEDSALVTGYVGVQQLRPGVRFRVSSRSRLIHEPTAAGPTALPARETPSDAEPWCDQAGDLGLISDYCTRPLPSFVTRKTEGGVFETNLEFNGVGRAAALTYFMRRVVRSWSSSGAPSYHNSVISRAPTEVLIVDQLLPVGWTDPASAHVGVYGDLANLERGWDRNEADRLPISETNTHLGNSIERLHTPDFPRYTEMIRAVLRDLAMEKVRFDVYRCRVQYPVLHACVAAGATVVPRT